MTIHDPIGKTPNQDWKDDPPPFLKEVIDNIPEHIVVIDNEGTILLSNRGWCHFGESNGLIAPKEMKRFNYLEECDKAALAGDEIGREAAQGIRQVINGEQPDFYLEYPCHGPTEKRWFMMRVSTFMFNQKQHCVISHQNITERKLAEEQVQKLARIDGLTQIYNRRYFDEFLNAEWRRCARLDQPISLAIIDIDYFKNLNDRYGHQTGDECLKQVASVLDSHAKRASDCCARYGGEEFALIFGGTELAEAQKILNQVQEDIRALNIPNESSETGSILTVSAGLVTAHSLGAASEKTLIEAADSLLYEAKDDGRDCIKATTIDIAA